jgi:hypothetical protein
LGLNLTTRAYDIDTQSAWWACGHYLVHAGRGWSGVEVTARFVVCCSWKSTYPKDYHTAYVSLGIPQILEPFVRLEMVRWEPLQNIIRGASMVVM